MLICSAERGKTTIRPKQGSRLVRWLPWLFFTLFLVSCGGGGSSTLSDDDSNSDGTPTAVFSASPTSGEAPLTVTFDASASSDSNGSIVQYDWLFGDGTSASGVSATHSYVAGTFTVHLTVRDDEGSSDTATRTITVFASDTQTYSISGSVSSAEYIVSDSDVNDSNDTPIGNDSFASAQELHAPVTVSGYVNVPGAGSYGNSRISGDTDDYFKVSLSQGMNISLYMAQSRTTNLLNVYLYNSESQLIDSTSASASASSNYATLTVPADGTWYIRVEAVSSRRIATATVYTLTLGKSSLSDSLAQLRLSDPFVPGEVLVRFAEPSDDLSSITATATTLSAQGIETIAGHAGRDRLLQRSAALDREQCFTKLGVNEAFERSIAPGHIDAAKQKKLETLWLVRAIREQPGVLHAEPNYIRQPLALPNDSYYPYQWHYPLINLPQAWDITQGDNEVVVAVVDTGVLLSHPDLNGQLVDGYDFISDSDMALDGDGVDDDPDDPGDQDGVNGSSFHGTHVAGTIAAASNNASGVAGIAWNTKIMPLRVLGYGGGTSYDIIQAIKYAAGLATDYDIPLLESPVAIINLSLGGESYSATEASVYQQVRDQGVIIVAAAGNSGTSAPLYPAAYPGVISVSAVTIDEEIAPYSNVGSSIDIAAPGGSSTDLNGDGYVDGVLSTNGDDSNGTIEMSYGYSLGTSMATPHVAGVTALMKAVDPDMTPANFEGLLASGALTRDLGASGRDDLFGYGLIDAYKAVLAAQSMSDTAILSVSPGNLTFAPAATSATVSLTNSGAQDASLEVDQTDWTASWLTVTPNDNVTDSGLGDYTVSVDREGLADGIYSDTISFVAAENSATVSVVMQTGTSTATSDGGYHYILLLDADSLETISQTGSAGIDGVYDYSFSGLSATERYVVYAGTDPDNDNRICAEGEICGAYLSLDKPAVLTVQSDLTGIDFASDIIANISSAGEPANGFEPLSLSHTAVKQLAP